MKTAGVWRAAGALLGARGRTAPDPTRILVALLMPIGDVLLCEPALAALRRRFPRARLTGLAIRARAPLVAMSPYLDDLIVYDAEPERDAVARLDVTLAAIQADPFGMIVSFSTAGNCVALLSGIPRQVWQRLPWLFWLWGSAFDRPYRARHAVEHYWDVVAPLGLRPQGPADGVPRWHVPAADRAAAGERLRAAGVAPGADGPLVFVHPGALGFGGRKRWPAERFGLVAAALAAEGARIVVLGGPTDGPAAEQIVAALHGRAVNFAGQTSVRESVSLIAHADLYLGNDSGLTHFAVALDVPTVALFGVSNLRHFAPRPADPRRLVVLTPAPLPPPAGNFIGVDSIFFPPRRPPDDRLLTIAPPAVLAAARALLAAVPSRTDR